MVRKRDPWTRARDLGHRRPKTPAPKTRWLLGELAELAGLPATTVRYSQLNQNNSYFQYFPLDWVAIGSCRMALYGTAKHRKAVYDW
jgi:hypothetical protein